MTLRNAALVLAMAALLVAVPHSTRASTAERPPGFQSSDYRAVRSKSEIPPAVLELFASLCGVCPLADFGAPFNATDFIEPGLPMRRLLAAGVSGNRWFLEYEHGGRGRHFHFALFELQGSSARCVWANGPPPTGCRAAEVVRESCPW